MASSRMGSVASFCSSDFGYSAAPVMTGMGLIRCVLVSRIPPSLRYSTHRAASSSSKEMMMSASPLSMMGE